QCGVGRRPANVDADVAALRPPERLKLLPERRDAGLCFWSVSASDINTPTRRIRSTCCARAASGHAATAAEQRDELAAPRIWWAAGSASCVEISKRKVPLPGGSARRK